MVPICMVVAIVSRRIWCRSSPPRAGTCIRLPGRIPASSYRSFSSSTSATRDDCMATKCWASLHTREASAKRVRRPDARIARISESKVRSALPTSRSSGLSVVASTAGCVGGAGGTFIRPPA
jgi:hypothetical protein